MLAQPSGVLRASMPEGFANIFLAPLVADFARSCPGIRLEFDRSPRPVDLVTESVDMVIRMGEPPSSKVGGRFLLDSVGMIQRLATLHMGIAVLARDIVTDDVASGRLRRVLPDWQATLIPVYAMTETRLLPAKTQRFIDFLREHLGRIQEGTQRALFSVFRDDP